MRCLAVAAAVAFAIFGSAVTASATTSFGSPSPTVVGPSVSLSNVDLRVTATDPDSIKSATLRLDGVSKTPNVAYAGTWATDGCVTWFVPDYTSATIGFRVPLIAVGTHSVAVTVTNNLGQTATSSWTLLVQPAQVAFSAFWPGVGATVPAWDTSVSVVVADAAGVSDGPYLTIDGAAHPLTLLYGYGSGWVTYDEWNYWSYNFYPGPAPLDMGRALASFTPGKLADGPHTASLAITDATGRTASTTWDFTVAAPPRISQLSPAEGGATATRTPTISAHLADNGTIAATTMTVDGVAVTPVWDAASGTVSYKPAAPLANDRAHTASVTATDTSGLSTTVSWSFTVQVFADMPQPGTCTDCHDATQHPMNNCAACHNVVYIGHGHGGPISWCLTCHHTSGHGPEVIIPGVTWGGGDEPQPGYTGYWGAYCDHCHSPAYPSIPQHAADNAQLHMTTTDMASCTECHTRELTREHFRYKDAAGKALDCWTCHGDAAPAAVKSAIAAGTTACEACHTGAQHEALHGVAPRTDDCVRCHAGDSLTVIHVKRGCSVCHASTDPAVTAAVAAGDKTCATCHGTAGHEALHVVAPRSDACVTCHAGDSLTTIHAKGGCDGCHTSTDARVIAAILAGNKACSACHVTAGVDYHTNMAAAHIAPVSYYDTCGHCHHAWGSNPIQGPNITRHAAGCTLCHNATTDLTGKTAACDSCHKAEGVDFHPRTGAYHAPTDAASLGCADCHKTTDVRALHTTSGCQTCHSTYSCTECHAMHGGMGGGGLLAGTACAGCHATAGVDYHRNVTAAHTFTAMPTDCQQAGCHVNTLVEAHAGLTGAGGRYPQYATSCQLCHENSDPARIPATATADCSSCHGSAHGDLAALHTATMGGGTVTVFTSHEPGAARLPVDCSLCHATGNLMAIHANDCMLCHGGADPVRKSFTTWNGTCSQGACHPSVTHPLAQAAHDQLDCDWCHNPDSTVPPGNCAGCHNPDPTAVPVTTSDALASYIGTATIHLSAGPGVTITHWRLDGGALQTGRALTVLPPDIGTAAHVLEFWSTTDRGVPEATHRTVAFAVTRDVTPPVTSADGGTSYTGPALINLSVVDDDVLPVAVTYWSLDGAAATAGRVIRVPQPASGTATHDLRFWSIDAAGNVESPKTKSFTVTADLVPPVTVWPGDPDPSKPMYDRSLFNTFAVLVATDPQPGSGVAKTYNCVDNTTVWPNAFVQITGEATHTVRYWSVDVAGNTEATKWLTVVKDWHAPVTTSNAVGLYTGTASIALRATDLISGVAATYYQFDGGAVVSGSSPTIGTAGGHTLRFWSVDKAGNTETASSVSFTVNAGTPITAMSGSLASVGVARLSFQSVPGSVTYYRLDEAAPVQGTSIVVPGPVSGSTAHTLEYWSVDASGAAEAHHFVLFSVSAEPAGHKKGTSPHTERAQAAAARR